MGVVYEALDRERNQLVALKTLRWFDARALLRFKNEFRALHDIDHPNLISLYELCEEDGECFFTMELVRGVDFLAYVRGASQVEEIGDGATLGAVTDTVSLRGRSVAPSEDTLVADEQPQRMSSPGFCSYDQSKLRSALKQLAQGVAALHATGRVHRDIKPSNILVTEAGRVVLLDFGLVTEGTREAQSTQAVVGTAEYMAPEQAISGDVGPAADWYSVGVVLYQALTSRLPHRGKTAVEILLKKQQMPAAPPRQWIADVPKDLDALCEMLLSAEPGERPPVATIFGQLGIAADDAPTGKVSPSTGFTQTTPFVGRDDELAELHAAFEDSKKQPVVVIVEGESGLGKSELARQFTERLTNDVADVVVLAGRCYERESVAYKAFDGIVDELSRYMTRLPRVESPALLPLQAGLLPRLFPVLQRVEAIAAAPKESRIPDPQEMRRQMFSALRELLARVAKRSPLVLVIDDLQWTDTDSLILLQELLADKAAPRLLLIATMRPVAVSKCERIRAAMNTLELRHMELAAFSFEHAKELAAVVLPAFDDEALGMIAKEAGGHPLFVMELARYAQGQGQEQEQDQNQDQSQSQSQRHGHGRRVILDEMFWQRISRLPADLLALLEILCVAGTPLSQETAANAAEMAPADLSRAASVLRISYLVRTGGVRKDDIIEPYHDRVRESVTMHLGDAARIRCHHRLAIALEQAGAAQTSPQALVRHAEAAGDVKRAAEYAEAAAHHAVAATAFDQAADFLQIALRLGEHKKERVRELRLRLAEAFVNAGRGPEAGDVFVAAAEGADDATRRECHRQAAEQWLISGHLDKGRAMIDMLLAEIGERMPATSRSALFRLLWQRARLRSKRLRWKERPDSQITRDELIRIDIFKAAGHGLAMIDTIRGFYFHTRGLQQALRVGERSRIALALYYECNYLASSGGERALARARRIVDKAAAIDEKDPYLLAWKSVMEGCTCYFGSDFRRAAELLADGEARFRKQVGATWELGTTRLVHLWSLLRLGVLSESQALLDTYLRDAVRRGDLYVQTTLVRSNHLIWLAKDDLDQVHRVLKGASWAPPIGRYHLQHWYQLKARGEIALYDGTATGGLGVFDDDFEALKNSMLLRIITVRLDARWLRGRLALVSALDSDESPQLLKEAGRMARLLEREKDVFANAAALLLRAAIAGQKGDVSGAMAILATAVTSAEESDLLLHAAAARRRLGELMGGDEGAALVARADEWMASEAIDNPQRMTEVFAPGY